MKHEETAALLNKIISRIETIEERELSKKILNAMAKQIPEVPRDVVDSCTIKYKSGFCNSCGEELDSDLYRNYCPNCGQRIDWKWEDEA